MSGLEVLATTGLVAAYGGTMYGYYKFLSWLEGPRRCEIQPGVSSCVSDDSHFYSGLLNRGILDEDVMQEMGLDIWVLKYMEPKNRERYVDAKLSISIAKRKKIPTQISCEKKFDSFGASGKGYVTAAQSCQVACVLKTCSEDDGAKSLNVSEDSKEEESTEEDLLKADLGKVELSDLNIRSTSLFYAETENLDPHTTHC